MRETSFIKQNKDKWAELERVMDKKEKDPEQLNELFIKVTDDLSYSRTYYSNRSVRVYLNGLAQRIFYSIYKNKRSRISRFKDFWTTDLPILVYESKVAFRISFGVFMAALLIGVISSINDPNFAQAILGESYIDMTIENIESGDPMAVYKSKGKTSMSIGITLNNIFVAFRTFILGAFFMVGSIGILLYNGIMVGAFQYFFFEQGLLQESALTIWMHGTLEISAIVIAGAAGITMGRGLVFPGTLSRINAFQLSARRGLKIMIGVTPLFIVAGFIEGFLTRITEAPDILRLLFILICLAFVIGYFVILPVILGRTGKKVQKGIADLQPKQNEQIDLGIVKNTGQIFSDLFVLIRKKSGSLMRIAALCAALFTLLCLLFGNAAPTKLYAYSPSFSSNLIFSYFFKALDLLPDFFNNSSIGFLPIINCVVFFLMSLIVTNILSKEFDPERHQQLLASRSKKTVRALKLLFLSSILSILLFISIKATLLLAFFVLPIIFVWIYRSALPDQSPIQDLRESLNLVFSGYGRGLKIFGVLVLLLGLFLCSLTTSLWSFSLEVISWNLPLELEIKEEIVTLLYIFIEEFIILFSFAIFIITGALLYYTLLEKESAFYLKQKVQNIGVRRTLQGLDQENQVHGL